MPKNAPPANALTPFINASTKTNQGSSNADVDPDVLSDALGIIIGDITDNLGSGDYQIYAVNKPDYYKKLDTAISYIIGQLNMIADHVDDYTQRCHHNC